ncbi:circadian associated repressor of transcription a isoform X2 [Dunckerocampus dactyliophorus]|nr:circadian associated repressor of transcription a isoform X2 [Dunckerocampus dactyliophorus]
MQSQGSTSSQPSFDSLSSSDSLLLSDSEDADVFLTDSSTSAILDGVGGSSAHAGRASESPGSQWACDGFTDKDEEEEAAFGMGSKAARDARPAGQVPKSQGDLLFAQKCAELQGFVRPLMELLNGLKKGRFDRGLSSFQQSVAMDRIQRIVGVLQRPNCGEKYLNTLLQVEMMLKLWFPHIASQPVSSASSVASSPARSLQDVPGTMPPHKHRDQLHIPVKKRRLSWTGTDSPTPSPGLPKCPRLSPEEKKTKEQGDDDDEEGEEEEGSRPPPSSLASPDMSGDTKGSGDGEFKAGQGSEPSLTWMHVAPILSPRKTCPSREGTPAMAAASSEDQLVPAGGRGSPATQDSSVSSTTPSKHTKNLKKATRCQSQPAAEQQSETKSCQAQSQSSHTDVKPLTRACRPTPLET